MVKNIYEYINKDKINLNLKSKNKNGILKEMYENLCDLPEILDKEKAYIDLLDRERMGSTGIGKSVAIPHAKSEHISDIVLTVGISDNSIPYDSIDDIDARIFFMFLAPKELSHEYLIILARMSRLISNESFRTKLLNAKTQEEIVEIIKNEELN